MTSTKPTWLLVRLAHARANANANATNKGPSSAWSFSRFAQRTMKKESVLVVLVGVVK